MPTGAVEEGSRCLAATLKAVCLKVCGTAEQHEALNFQRLFLCFTQHQLHLQQKLRGSSASEGVSTASLAQRSSERASERAQDAIATEEGSEVGVEVNVPVSQSVTQPSRLENKSRDVVAARQQLLNN